MSEVVKQMEKMEVDVAVLQSHVSKIPVTLHMCKRCIRFLLESISLQITSVEMYSAAFYLCEACKERNRL